MKPLEIALLLVNVPLLLWCLSGRALPAWGPGLSFVALAAMAAHLLFESGRFHFIAGYLAIVLELPRLSVSRGLPDVWCWVPVV
jgi:hypothetical protein